MRMGIGNGNGALGTLEAKRERAIGSNYYVLGNDRFISEM